MILRREFLAVFAEERQARSRGKHCSDNRNPRNEVKPNGVAVHYVHQRNRQGQYGRQGNSRARTPAATSRIRNEQERKPDRNGKRNQINEDAKSNQVNYEGGVPVAFAQQDF